MDVDMELDGHLSGQWSIREDTRTWGSFVLSIDNISLERHVCREMSMVWHAFAVHM